MSEQKASYRQIMKATTLFGGVQVINIIISIIRSKFVAVLLGPAGMGIMGLLTSTTGLISNITNFGLGTSAIKDIAAAYGKNDEKRIKIVISAIRKMVWITGFTGLLITAVFSPWLSQLTFGNKEYTVAFLWLSVTLLFNQLSSGQLVVLQGLRKLNYLARANLTGSFTGLFITIPLYFVWGLDGIVPGMIATSLLSLLMSWYFSGKIELKRIQLSFSETFAESKNMLHMGLMISLSGILTVGASYIVRIFINRTGGLEQVGLFNAGFIILNTYVSLIFKAMATDYYPRLSSVAHDNKLSKQVINQQAEIAILVMAPILIVFLIFINWVVILLYSKDFIEVNSMIHWAALGMFFKVTSQSVAFILLAKSATRLFFWNELLSNFYLLILNLIGYHFWGLTGLGISFALSFLIYLIHMYFVSKIKFDFSFETSFLKIFFVQIGFAILSFIAVYTLKQLYTYIVGIVLIAISGLYSFKELDKRLGIKSIVENFIKSKYDSNKR